MAHLTGNAAIQARILGFRMLQFALQARTFHDAVYNAWRNTPPGPLHDGLGRYTNFTDEIIENLRENIAREIHVTIPGS